MSKKENNRSPDGVPDETIINMYWARNEAAITATDDKYGKFLYTISYNILNDRFDSEESLNDTYFATWNRIPPTRPVAFQRFLAKITRDISISKYRKAHAQRRIPSEMTVSLNEFTECVDVFIAENEKKAVEQISEVLNSYLSALSKKDQFIFVCRYYYADPVQYIAKMLDVGEKSVYRDISRIKNGLREALLEKGIVL